LLPEFKDLGVNLPYGQQEEMKPFGNWQRPEKDEGEGEGEGEGENILVTSNTC
jgi:hypothetical protein